jgi:hypothetical protein
LACFAFFAPLAAIAVTNNVCRCRPPQIVAFYAVPVVRSTLLCVCPELRYIPIENPRLTIAADAHITRSGYRRECFGRLIHLCIIAGTDYCNVRHASEDTDIFKKLMRYPFSLPAMHAGIESDKFNIQPGISYEGPYLFTRPHGDECLPSSGSCHLYRWLHPYLPVVEKVRTVSGNDQFGF